MDKKSHFKDFMVAARENLDDFEKDYLENHEKNPEMYPLEIDKDNDYVWWGMLLHHNT